MPSNCTVSRSVMERFSPLFRPRTVAVVGASSKSNAQGNRFIRQLRHAGFDGAIYPIHPTELAIEGLKAYPSFAHTPEPIDYAFVAVAGERVPELLAGAQGRVRFAQVMSSGFAETVGGRVRENALVDAAMRGGLRLLGPNCMGTYSSRGRLTFVEGGSDSPGSIGVMSQSGGLAIDLIHRGRSRGLHFSGIVSMGNCADLGPNDFLEYFLEDPDTQVIGAYLEHIRNGRSFFEQLRGKRASKPVVILKGGRTLQGQRAAASHTGSLSGDDRIWFALARQTGSILVDTLDEFIDVLVAFQSYSPRQLAPNGRVLLFGNGGGASVLGTDYLARVGLEVAPLERSTAKALEELDLPAGASTANPIDIPANVLSRQGGAIAHQILKILASKNCPEAILMHVNLGVILGYREVDMLADLIDAAVRARSTLVGRTHLSIALRSNGEPEIEERKHTARLKAMEGGIPVFDEIPNQARAAAAIHAYEQFRFSRLA